MENPRVEIDLTKIRHNTEQIVKACGSRGISVTGVTKAFCGDPEIAGALAEGGVGSLSDSRIENLIKLRGLRVPKIFLRLPMVSDIEDVVRYADVSLNSEISTISLLARESIRQHKRHGVILMVDLGDLREGVWFEQAEEMVPQILSLDGVGLVGIGTNLTCLGGVLPTEENLSALCTIAERIRSRYGIRLPIVSGGNSSSLYLVYQDRMPRGINNLRIGEAILLGHETGFRKKLPHLFDDAFIICGEIVEKKTKPSSPVGRIASDAFGEVPRFENRGRRIRAIVAIGRQDIDYRDMIPLEEGIEIVGASSDHLVLDVTDCRDKLTVGAEVRFKLGYGCLLRCMTSAYVKKDIKNGERTAAL